MYPILEALESLGPNMIQFVKEILMFVALGVVMWTCYVYRSRVIFALTGDDRIHATSLDCVWSTFFTCFGRCNGDWTRNLTLWCPDPYKGVNLVKELGKYLGFASYSIRLTNIVVGDLPFSGHGDFYICVECAANPPMVTSIAEDSDPKTVHFPESIILKIRKHLLEGQVRIIVKEINVLGSQDLCDLHLNAVTILDWVHGGGGDDSTCKRFVLKPLDRACEYETAPWIYLSFDKNCDPRESSSTSTVRTIGTKGLQEMTTESFKNKYRLVDNTGLGVDEPSEVDLQEIRFYRQSWQYAVAALNFFVCVVLMVYCLFRFYIGSCYRQFVWQTSAKLLKETFPLSTVTLHNIVDECFDKIAGTGIAPGIDPCLPSYEQVLDVCDNGIPNQIRPEAFVELVHQLFGLNIRGFHCVEGVCPLHRHVSGYDELAFCIIVGLVIFIIATNCMVKAWLRKHKIRQAKHREILLDEVRMRTQQPTRLRSLNTAGWV